MKIICVSLFLLMPLMAVTTIADEKEARVFYQRLDDAFVRHDVKQMISLLAELSGGPVNGASDQSI